jgi:hypothetical protein
MLQGGAWYGVVLDERECLSFQDFWLELSQQMLMYDPCQQMYQVNEDFRMMTKLGKRKRAGRVQYWKGEEKGRVSLENLMIAKKSSSRYSPSHLCDSLDDLEKHMANIAYKKKQANVHCVEVAPI